MLVHPVSYAITQAWLGSIQQLSDVQHSRFAAERNFQQMARFPHLYFGVMFMLTFVVIVINIVIIIVFCVALEIRKSLKAYLCVSAIVYPLYYIYRQGAVAHYRSENQSIPIVTLPFLLLFV